MITKEFRRWVEGIRDSIEKRLKKIDYVGIWMDTTHPRVISIFVVFDCVKFWMSFNQVEYDSNNPKQRRSLAKCRRDNLIREIGDMARVAARVARALK